MASKLLSSQSARTNLPSKSTRRVYPWSQRYAKYQLPELVELESLLERGNGLLRWQELLRCSTENASYPIYSVAMGNDEPDAPTIVFVGGIHGLERIGTEILLAYLETLIERQAWDETLQTLLSRVKILFLPLMNPVGMFKHQRANGNGVDLMRNAPVEADEPVWMAGGQRLSSWLPWYRGQIEGHMERENRALVDVIESQVLNARFALVMDCHSGFGMRDRIWFPYAKSRTRAIKHLPEVYQLRRMLFRTYPNLNYAFEPQSLHYVTHGDLWDYVYGLALERNTTLLPLTLELGSWLWVKKNPLQMRSALGMFHPLQPHRIQRVLRHHQVLFDFLIRACCSYERWLPAMDRKANMREACQRWYPNQL